MIVYKGSNIKIIWRVTRNGRLFPLDFRLDRLEAALFIVGAQNKHPWKFQITGKGEVSIEIPANSLREGTYSLQMVWRQNISQKGEAFIKKAFILTDDPNRIACKDAKYFSSEVPCVSMDGLSAYDFYILDGGSMTLKEWIDSIVIPQSPIYNLEPHIVKYPLGGFKEGDSLKGLTWQEFAQKLMIGSEAPETFTITPLAGEGYSVTPTGPVIVEKEKSAEFTFTASNGYKLVAIHVDGSPAELISAQNYTYSFENVTKSHTIQAVAIRVVTIQTAVNNTSWGSVSPAEITIPINTSTTIRATPASGYMVDRWAIYSDDHTVQEGGIEYTVNAGIEDLAYKVYFKSTSIEVDSIEITGEQTCYIGETSQLVAVVSPSNATDKSITWSSNSPSTASVDSKGLVTGLSFGLCQITATASNGVKKEISFSVKNPQITATTGVNLAAGGSVIPSGANKVEYYTSFSVTATANAGYKFTGWEVNGTFFETTNNTWSVSRATSDMTITAIFEKEDEGRIFYGYMTYEQAGLHSDNLETYKMTNISWNSVLNAEEMGTMTDTDVQIMGRTSLGIVPKYAFIVVAVPKSSNKVVTRDNGLGGKVAFSGDYAENGADVTWNGITYSLFGFYTITSGERFIYVDNK